jgi:hypothetical protein
MFWLDLLDVLDQTHHFGKTQTSQQVNDCVAGFVEGSCVVEGVLHDPLGVG